MKSGTPHDPSPEDRLEENDAVWRLLAQAPRPEPDAWFTARTMARCRHEGLASEETTVAAVSRVWRWVLGGGMAVSMAVALMVSQAQTEKAEKQKNVQEAFEIMASIDNTDSDSSSSTSWQDSSL